MVEIGPGIFNSAPVLVKNKIPIILDTNEKVDDSYIFSCIPQKKSTNQYSSCDYIFPGELKHLGNPNPRSILATKGNKTYFICIEGRKEKEYKGATVEQMQEFLTNYLKVDDAINLDGGASVSLMWNINGQVYSPLDYFTRKTLSNVISFNF